MRSLRSALAALVFGALALSAADAQATRLVNASSGKRFEVGRLVGKGGFGRVYKGWQIEAQGRKKPVALKMYDSLAGAVGEDQPLRGVGKLAHVPRLVAEGFDERSGRSFLVTPWVNGRTLAQWNKLRKPTPDQIVAAVGKAAQIVERLHGHGWLHLDLKPQNIMIDRKGEVNLIDLGLAQRKEHDGKTKATGAGTRQFMSPEQRDADTIDDRADVFALAGTLYMLLTKDRPIAKLRTPTLIGTKLDRIEDPRLRAIVQKGLSERAEDRYASAAAFAEALAAWSAR